MPLFSVIVPVYNASKTIERCVRSICESGQDEVEVILVDDCSKDDSYEKCLQLCKCYPHVKTSHNEMNKGVSYTRNRAIQNATGEYLLFVDSDDYVDKEYVPTFLRLIQKGIDFAVCGYFNHDELQSGICQEIAWEKEESCVLCEIIEKLQQKTLLQQLWNKVFVTKKVREKSLQFDESISIGEDTRFILDYILQNNITQITCINQALYHYMRDNNGSLMYTVGYESIEEPLKNMRKMYQIMGWSQGDIDKQIVKDREWQIQSYAYLIMHNMGMPMREKKCLIYRLDRECGKALYKKQKQIYYKEKIANWLKKAGLRK